MEAKAAPSDTFDYVIVGAGSAGCLLANRLTSNPDIRVLLLEAGGRDDYFWLGVPMALSMVIGNPRVDWCFRTEPEPFADLRSIPIPRGKVLGGSSAINAMCCVRGHSLDYDLWRQLGNQGWSWSDVLPYFQSIERYSGEDPAGTRGKQGAQPVTLADPAWRIVRAWRDAAVESGINPITDYNSGESEGVAFMQWSIDRGRRASTARSFLHPVKNRPNLEIRTHAVVRGLLFDGPRVTGVNFSRDTQAFSVAAREEVILAAGAIGSPQILELSGVGSSEALTAAGVPVRLERLGVGEHMLDHWGLRQTYSVKGCETMNERVSNPVRRYLMGARYLATRGGPLSAPPPQANAFVRSNDLLERPNIQIFISPYSSSNVNSPIDKKPGFSTITAVLRPPAVGFTHIASPNHLDAPKMRQNYLETDDQRQAAIAGLRISRKIIAQPALASLGVEERTPGAAAQSESEILAFARANVMSSFHQSGTCKMGVKEDRMAVVDSRLRVYGLEGLRVVDSSIMPMIPSGNTNIPTLMIAEKGAAMILDDRKARHASKATSGAAYG